MRHFVLCALLVTCGFERVEAAIEFTDDFESPVGSEWSSASTSTTPSGTTFLGEFRNDTVSLTLTGLPQATLRLSFDLYIIGTWDGNLPTAGGPDIWDLTVRDGPNLLHTTFGNWEPSDTHGQAYPGTYDGGSYS